MARVFRFDRFELDLEDRRLSRDGAPIEVSARYLDALALMIVEPGRLVTKDRFMSVVWKGVPVTDEALTQCIRSLRRALGDDATRPRLIETVPKHGYRFLAEVTEVGAVLGPSAPARLVPGGEARPPSRWDAVFTLARAGTIGGGAAGTVGGLIYGALGVLGGDGAGASGVLVMMIVTALIGMAGGAGVGFGIGAVDNVRAGALGLIGGGLVGGLLVGAVVRLLGLDALDLLFGGSPRAITGAVEGAVLGAAVGASLVLGDRLRGSWRRRGAVAGVMGALAGIAIALGGGRLLIGSLDTLANAFPASRLTLAPVSSLFGEAALGPVSHAAASGLEGFLFCACVAVALAISRPGRSRIEAGAKPLGPRPVRPSAA